MEPGLLRLRRRRLHDEADHAPVSPSGGQHQAARLLLRGLLHSQTADLGGTQDACSNNGTTRRRGRRAGPEAHLDAVFEGVPRQGETFLLVDGLAENDQLLKEEHPPLSGSGRDGVVLLADEEGVLLEQLSLRRDLTLGRQEGTPVSGNSFTSTKISKNKNTQSLTWKP